jgi:hypothetical protein
VAPAVARAHRKIVQAVRAVGVTVKTCGQDLVGVWRAAAAATSVGVCPDAEPSQLRRAEHVEDEKSWRRRP